MQTVDKAVAKATDIDRTKPQASPLVACSGARQEANTGATPPVNPVGSSLPFSAPGPRPYPDSPLLPPAHGRQPSSSMRRRPFVYVLGLIQISTFGRRRKLKHGRFSLENKLNKKNAGLPRAMSEQAVYVSSYGPLLVGG